MLQAKVLVNGLVKLAQEKVWLGELTVSTDFIAFFGIQPVPLEFGNKPQ